jgi:glycosyltransferase (activator-dependent family)
MRVLLATVYEPSHLYVQVPLGWALVAAGHDVRVASSPGMMDHIRASGLTAVSVGADHTLHQMFAAQASQGSIENELTDWSRPYRAEQTWDAVLMKYRISVPFALRPYNDCIMDDLVAFARSWQPDLVLWDPLTYAGAVAAKVTGAAHARINFQVDYFAAMRGLFLELRDEQPLVGREDPLEEWLTRVVGAYGQEYSEDLAVGQWTLDLIPDSLQIDSGVTRVPVRPIVYNGPSQVPAWLREPPQRPRVCVTSGVSTWQAFGEAFMGLPAMIDALGDLDVDVVAAIPDEQAEQLTNRPANLVHAGFVPLLPLLPTCSVAVHHGGYGAWAGALGAGVPQYMSAIRHGDRWMKAEGITAAGAGLMGHPSAMTPEDFVRDVNRLLTEPGFADSARKLREEYLAMPSPAAAVSEIVRLTAQHGGREGA